eukprot:4245409-Prymnesium_polylepis.2
MDMGTWTWAWAWAWIWAWTWARGVARHQAGDVRRLVDRRLDADAVRGVRDRDKGHVEGERDAEAEDDHGRVLLGPEHRAAHVGEDR